MIKLLLELLSPHLQKLTEFISTKIQKLKLSDFTWLFSYLFIPGLVVCLHLTSLTNIIKDITSSREIIYYQLKGNIVDNKCNSKQSSVLVLKSDLNYEISYKNELKEINYSVRDTIFQHNIDMQNIIINNNLIKIPSQISGFNSGEIILYSENVPENTIYINSKSASIKNFVSNSHIVKWILLNTFFAVFFSIGVFINTIRIKEIIQN